MNLVFRDSQDPLAGIVERGGSILVVGLGDSGISAANLMARAGCRVTVSERGERGQTCADLSLLEPGVEVVWGGHPWELFGGSDLVVVSPGVPSDIEPLARSVSKGIPVIGEMELAFRLTSVPWVCVTGSNGKSTTVTLLDLMARRGGLKVVTGGNIGTPATSFVGQTEGLDFLIAEVSSFQLETTENFHPSIAALLNLSPDHLDRYSDYGEYVAAKARIFSRMEPGDKAVYNADDPGTVELISGIRADLFPFTRRVQPVEGAYLENRRIRVRDGKRDEEIVGKGAIALSGTHNLENALAAVAVGWKMGIPPRAMAEVLRTFRGLEHRMELVGHFRGVPIFNDSKGTNVGATLRSLEGLGDRVILILGGKDKGTSYEPLRGPIRRKVPLLILLGEAADRMERAFQGATRILRVGSVDEAVKEAIQNARPGSEILFSPACSSFDMFSGFEERGLVFKSASRKYLEMAG
jgi:UDP-N-acetylmuramoylalanine--D-glutamate ligase